jgi:hypothetical protein
MRWVYNEFNMTETRAMYTSYLGLKGEGVFGHVTTSYNGTIVTDLLTRLWMEVTGQLFVTFA